MPPRPPVTTLVLHTWKEHGKPRPLAPAGQSAASARRRIARSLSVDAALSATAAGARDDDNVPHPPRAHARACFSRSSTFEDALALHAQTAAAGRTMAVAAHALATSYAADGGADAAPRIVNAPLLPQLQEKDSFSSATPRTLMDSHEQAEPGAHSTCPAAMEALPPRLPPHQPPMDPASCTAGQGGGGITLITTSASPPCGLAAETAKKASTRNWRSRRAYETLGRKAERHTGQAGRPCDAEGLACGEPQ